MPKVIDGGLEKAERYVAMDVESREAAIPIVDAIVVYLGANPKKSVPLKGRVMSETFGEGEDIETVKTPVIQSGFTPYDFSTLDNRGRPIKGRLIPANFPEESMRGRPFTACEHPEHLWLFAEMVDDNGYPEFRVFPAARHKRLMEEYFLRKQRMRGNQQSLYRAVSKVG